MHLFNCLNNNNNQKINTMQREKEDTKTTKPDEACCDKSAAKKAPVTVEMIQEAYDRLEELVNQCKTPVLLCMLAQNDLEVNHKITTNDSVIKAPGNKGIKWNAARGFLFASGTCLSGNPEAVSRGIKYSLEFLQREKIKSRLGEILDTPFEN